MIRLLFFAGALILLSPKTQAADIPWLPSKAEVLQQSLDQLLNDGWEIIQGSMGFEGFVVTLQRRADVVLCEWSPHGEGGTGRSRCYKLN